MLENNMYSGGEPTNTTGTLKTTISLGKNPSIVHSGPFYLMKDFNTSETELTGSTNLLSHYNLEHSYNKFSAKKIKEQLSSFLQNLPGVLDGVQSGTVQDNSTLRSIIEKPPIVGKELLPLTSFQLAGFRLHPGPLPDQYKHEQNPQLTKKHKSKHKKHKKEGGLQPDTSATDLSQMDTHEHKKQKKQKRHEDDKERRKRKKEKKRKKQRPDIEPT